MNGVKRFFRLPFREKTILPEVFLRLFQARILLWLLPFKRIARGLGRHMAETPPESLPGRREEVQRISRALRRVGKRTPWESACLVRAIAGKKMLDRRGIPATLYLGVLKDNTDKKDMKAHAWLRSGDVILTGKEGVALSSYTVVSTFGSDGEQP